MANGAFNLVDSVGDAARATAQEAVNTAPTTRSDFKSIQYPGKYKVVCKNVVMKPKNAGDEKKYFPGMTAAKTGTLMMNLIVTTVDDVKASDGSIAVHKGSDIYYSFPFVGGSSATSESLSAIARFMRPTVTALLGHGDIEISNEWISENLLNEYDDDDKIIRGHKMTSQYYVDVDVDQRDAKEGKGVKPNGSWNLKVLSIAPWSGQPQSVNKIEPTSGPVDVTVNMSAPVKTAETSVAADIGPSDASTRAKAVPTIDDDLPF